MIHEFQKRYLDVEIENVLQGTIHCRIKLTEHNHTIISNWIQKTYVFLGKNKKQLLQSG